VLESTDARLLAPMNAALEKLVRLHQLQLDLARVEADLAELPLRRRAQDEKLSAERAQLDAARGAAEASAKARRTHETAVQDLETKRSKYKGQLMDVKTNKEYTAMLHEIEGVERDIRAREDLVLEEMEKAERLAADVKREEAAFKVVERAAKAERAEIDSREARLGAEAGRLRGERDAALAAVPEDARALYERVAKKRGTAVAEARDGECQTCHMKLRLQVWVELRQNEALLQCDSCNRILYYDPPPPTVVVEP
jgi:predicted  nucleic acid-binding Zn-ribbon protein